MAILTAAELKASREAEQAEVDGVSDADATEAIANAEANLNLLLGYKVVDSATTATFNTSTRGTSIAIPNKRIRSVSAITADGGDVGITDLTFDNFTLSNVYPFYGSVVVTGTFGFATTDDEYKIAKNWVLKAAVDELQQTLPDRGNVPQRDAEGVDSVPLSTRFSPQRRPDLADLLQLLPKHPNARGSEGLFTISTAGSLSMISDVDRAFMGLETVDDIL